MAGQPQSGSASVHQDEDRRAHGLDKIIVAASSNGRLIALENVHGQQIWTTRVPYPHFRLVALLEHQDQAASSTADPTDAKVNPISEACQTYMLSRAAYNVSLDADRDGEEWRK